MHNQHVRHNTAGSDQIPPITDIISKPQPLLEDLITRTKPPIP